MGLKWFHHKTSSADDPDIYDAVTQFGHQGYAVFFMMLEIYAREINRWDEDGFLTLSWVQLQSILRMKRKRIELVLSWFSERSRFQLRTNQEQTQNVLRMNEDLFAFKVNNFIDMLPRHYQRKNQKITKSKPKVGRVEREKEKEKEKTKEQNNSVFLENKNTPLFSPDAETAVSVPEPSNGSVNKKKNKKQHPPIDEDLVKFLSERQTLNGAAQPEYGLFWSDMVTLLSPFFDTDLAMTRYLFSTLADIDRWQISNKKIAKSQNGIQRRISNWIKKDLTKKEAKW